jgi:hypothetical protein
MCLHVMRKGVGARQLSLSFGHLATPWGVVASQNEDSEKRGGGPGDVRKAIEAQAFAHSTTNEPPNGA